MIARKRDCQGMLNEVNLERKLNKNHYSMRLRVIIVTLEGDIQRQTMQI